MERFMVEVRADGWVFTPVSPRARKWVEKNMFGTSITAQRGYVPCVLRALLAEGFGIVPQSSAVSGIEE